MNKGNVQNFVPMYKSTTIKIPEKLFFYVSQAENVKKEWFKSVHRVDEPRKWNYFYCEDHFDVGFIQNMRSDKKISELFELLGNETS